MVVLTSLWPRSSCMVRDSSTCQRPSWPVNSFFPAVFLRKVPLPFEFLAAWRIFWVNGIWKAYGSEFFVQILLVNFSDFLNLFFQICRDRLYVFDSGRFSWNLFLNCDSGFAFLFWTEAPFFSKKEDCLKKTALSDHFLRILIDKLGPYMCYVLFILHIVHIFYFFY